ncbi:MFS-type transporter clz9-like [Haliotis rubra]|uniref:MFS-type transporter clz9-like n=1 Tax=Haliotis rubra TaxID=36100 RepID=UPI001EE5E308|nr:MFS-type transporter clz9-like [Haliotis rubra]
MIAAVNAAGGSVPPYFVFPGHRMRDELLSGATPGTGGTVSETGWSNTEVFSTYMKTHLVRHLPSRSADSPVLILYDGHKSHVSLGLIEWARENHIVLFVLPPHTSHLLQPLDIGCYGPFETTWIRSCHSFLSVNSGKAIGKHDICSVACRVFNSTLTPVKILSSFTKSGIFPLNPEVIDDLAVIPARSFSRPTPAVSSSTGTLVQDTDDRLGIAEHKKQHPEKRKADKEVGKGKKKSSGTTSLSTSSLLSKGNSAQNKSKWKGPARKKRNAPPPSTTFSDCFSDSATDDD